MESNSVGGTPWQNGNGHPGGSHSSDDVDDQRELSLQDLLEIVRKGKWIIAGCFITVLSLTAAYTFLRAPEYQATSSLQVNSENSSPQLGDLFGLDKGFRNVLNEIEILKSRTIAYRVAERLFELPTPASEEEAFDVLAEPDEGPLTVAMVVDRLRDEFVRVSPVSQDVDFINIVAKSSNPREVAEIANFYAEEYVDYNQTASRARMRVAREYFEEATDEFYTQLQSYEDQLRGYMDQETVVAPEEEAKQLLDQITDLERMSYQTRSQLEMARSELGGLEVELGELVPGLASRLASADGKVIDRLSEEIAELEVRQQQRIARNPGLADAPDKELNDIRSQIKSLTDQLDQRIASLVDSENGIVNASETTEESLSNIAFLRRQITAKKIESKALEARLAPLDTNLEQYKARYNVLPGKQIRLNSLSRSYATQEKLYSEFFERLAEAEIAEKSELGYVEIIDHAVIPSTPVKPNIPINLVLGTMLGLMLGLLASFVRHALDNKVRRPEDVKKLGLSLMGAIPNLDRVIKSDFDGQKRVSLNGHSFDTSLITLLNPLSPVAEGYRRLRTNIQFSDPDRAIQVVMVTSAEPSEGKTVSSSNLAIAYAQSGRRTLYLDTDLRRANGHKVFGIAREPGLVDLLFDSVSTNLSTFASGIEDLFIIPAGRSVPNPAEVLESMKMQQFIERARTEFDVIVIDTPPLLAVADALLMTRQADACIVVCSANSTALHALESASSMLKDVGANLAGVVLNRMDGSGSSGYGYGYGYSYQNYYGEKPAGKSVAAA
ncbi:MAG: polysaccharide biosynthesis tyrosine autokinase [Rhodothermales bacterium]|nr:polysaccharide biosynthesis tyrosine autokinase [Rhodothermales bacterium]